MRAEALLSHLEIGLELRHAEALEAYGAEEAHLLGADARAPLL